MISLHETSLMHQTRTQLLSVAFSCCLAMGLPGGLSAHAALRASSGKLAVVYSGGGESGKDSASAAGLGSASASDPIAMHSQGRSVRTGSQSAAGNGPQAEPNPSEPGQRSVVFGKGVWEAGHAGLALPARCDSRIGEPLVIPGIEQFPENRILIFNSQGQKVFTQRGYANGWTGLDREGQPLPQGRYFVIVEVDGMGDDVQSYMNLVR